MVGAFTVQRHPELGGFEGNLCGELPGHIQVPREPMGPQELPLEGQLDSLRVHPVLLVAVQ